MNDRIIFQRDRLTVYETKVVVGNATVFYPSISACSIYEGRPFLAAAIVGIIGVVSFSFITLMGARLLGPYFPKGIIAISILPMIGLVSFGFFYQVKCLFLGVDGSSVAVLKSADRFTLEDAQRAIETAKRNYQQKNEN